MPKEQVPILVRRLFSEKACAETTHPGCPLLATESFHERMTNLLLAYPMNRRNFFLSVYEAYVLEAGIDWDNVRVVFEHSHTTFCLKAIADDFPDSRFIQAMRDPRALYNSYIVLVKRTGNVMEYWNIKRLLHGYSNVDLYWKNLPEKRYLILRNEDLLPPFEKEMARVSTWLGVDFFESMLEPTFGGKRWKGNSAYRDADKVSPKIMATRWENDLNSMDQCMVEFLFSRDIQLHGYKFLHLGKPLKRFSWDHLQRYWPHSRLA